MSLVRNTLSLGATSLAILPIGLATNILLARFLGTEQLGTYSVLQRFTTLAFLVFILGWPSVAIYRIRRMRVEPSLVTALALIAMTVASAAAIGLCLSFEARILETIAPGLPPDVFRVALALIPAQLFLRVLIALFRALDRFDTANWQLIGLNAGILVSLSIGFFAWETDLEGAVSIVAAVHVGIAALGAIVIVRRAGLRLAISKDEVVSSLKYGSKSHAQALAGQLHEQVDVLMLAALSVSASEVAFYAVAAGIVNRLKIVPSSISNALFPHVAGLEPAEAARVSARAARNVFAFTWLIAAGLAVAAWLLIPLAYGEPFTPAIQPTLVLLPAMALLTTYRVLSRYFMAIDRQEIIIATQVVSVVANVILNLLLIPRLGIQGAALSSLGSYGLELVMIVIAFRASTGLGVGRVFVMDRDDFAAIAQRLARLRRGRD